MTWRLMEPVWLWLLALLPALALWHGRRGAVAAIRYPSVAVLRTVAQATRGRPGGWLSGLKLLALALLIVALARPQHGGADTRVRASGIDIMLALDVSGSMQSLDFKLGGQPANRLDVVRSVVRDFIQARMNDRMGLLIFAGQPYLVSPMTLDHPWLLDNLERVRIGGMEDGTAIGSALAAGLNRLRAEQAKSKILILMTDGQNNSGAITPISAAEAARALGIKVYTIGIGVRGDAPMPVTDAYGNQHIVMEHVDVDEDTLNKIAALTNARFYRATDTDSLQRIYAEIDKLEKTDFRTSTTEHWDELYRPLLMVALALLVLALLLEWTWLRRLPA